MSTISRELRPFVSISSIEALVERIELRVGAESIGDGGRVVLSEEEFRTVPVAVVLPFGQGLEEMLAEIDEEIREVSLDLDDLLLVVNLYSNFLKISEYPHLVPLRELVTAGESLALGSGSRPKALQAVRSGCRVDVAVVLGTEKAPRVGSPWRKGTWLARARFDIYCEAEFKGFTPRPMDVETKSRLGLPPTATRYITLPDGLDPVNDEGSPELIEMWIDADLLAHLSSRDGAAVSAAIQQQLFVDAYSSITAIALARSDFLDRSWSDIQDSILGGLVRAVAGRQKGDTAESVKRRCEHLLEMLKNDFSQFMSYVESYADCTTAFMKSLGE